MAITRETLERMYEAAGLYKRTHIERIKGESPDTAATQKDKPSPTSSYSESQLRMFAKYLPGTAMTVVNSNSMEPFVDAGDVVLLETLKPEMMVRVMDVITFPYDDTLVLHRVVEIKGTKVRTKGDNNVLSDGWIERSFLKHRLYGVLWGKKKEKD